MDSTLTAQPDIQSVKQVMKAMWEDGDYGRLSQFKHEWDEDFLSRLPISKGSKVLDVACGTGHFCVLAAKRGAEVTGIDLATNLVEQARANAKKDGVEVKFDNGDAEALPYPDNSFDVVTSMIGAMFAPRPEKVASELLRVCKPNGIVAMANWTAEGIIGEMFRLSAGFAPPPPGMPSPLAWGNEDVVKQRFANGVKSLKLTRRIWKNKLPFSDPDLVHFFRQYFGPVKRAFESIDPERQKKFENELTLFWKKHNQATDGTHISDAEWLEVVAVKA